MTLEDAEKITDLVIKLFATKLPKTYGRVSQLRGYSAQSISSAFFLIIAKQRQIGGFDPALRKVSQAYAQKTEFIVGTPLAFNFLLDEDVDQLEKLQKDSNEFKRLLSASLGKRLEQYNLEEQKIFNRESFASFDDYCWSLDAFDPLYWQKVYTRLNLPYDETCPTGEPDMITNNRGNLAWKIKSGKDRRVTSWRMTLLWTVIAVMLLWLLIKLNQ